MKSNIVSPELRAVEVEIDSAYRTNPLMSLPFGIAAWHFLASCEERFVLPILAVKENEAAPGPFEQAELADHVINHARWPLKWLHGCCPSGGGVPKSLPGPEYTAAFELSTLASHYFIFETAFTCASLNMVELELRGNTIIPSGHLSCDTRFQAYDRLVRLEREAGTADLSFVADVIGHGVRLSGERFNYELTPRIIAQVIQGGGVELERRFTFPVQWDLGQFTLSDFSMVARALWAISAVHFVARLVAASQGCIGAGYANALVVMRSAELRRRLARYTGIAEARVQAIVHQLTYGNGHLRMPDPALQPLVSLDVTHIGWSPSLVLNSAMERNFIVLMNRSEDSRAAYSRLTDQREMLMRTRIIDELSGIGFTFWYGKVPGWDEPLDVDLAIISLNEGRCLLLELKSFLEPAEPREVQQKAEEIQKGVRQTKIRRELARKNPAALNRAMGISGSVEVEWAVASETSIGPNWVQDESVPVIRASHLSRKLREVGHLSVVCDWLRKRQYLPVEGRDYKTSSIRAKIGDWKLEWHGIVEA